MLAAFVIFTSLTRSVSFLHQNEPRLVGYIDLQLALALFSAGLSSDTGRYTLKTEHRSLFLLFVRHSLSLRFGQAFGLLVSVSLMPLSTYTSDLSTT